MNQTRILFWSFVEFELIELSSKKGGGISLKILVKIFFTFGIIPHFDLDGGGEVGGYGHLIRAEGGV
jgi:hypothetical protein